MPSLKARSKTTEFQSAPFLFGPRVSSVFAAHFLFIGLHLPYFPLWLKANDLTPAQIGLVLGMPWIVRVLLSSQVTSFADRQKDRASVVSFLYIFAAISILLYFLSDSFWPIVGVTLLFSFFFNPIMPILDAITLSGVRRFNADYGRIRIWGSLVFIVANLGGGALLAGYRPEAILYFLVAAITAGTVISFALPRIGRRQTVNPPISVFEAGALWRNPKFIWILLAAGFAQASHALLYSFGSIYWQALGFSGFMIGLLWAIGVLAEIVLFQFSAKLFKYASPVTLIAIGAFGGIVRWTLFPLIESELMFLALQILHGISFGAVHIATMHFIMDAVPEENIGSAQGVSFVLSGACMGLAVLAAGPIFGTFGANGFFVMALVAAMSLVCLLAARTFYPQSAGSGGLTSDPG